MWFHPLLNHGFWGDYCSLCQGFTYWNRASLQPVAWFWLTPGVCARGYLWHPVTLTPAASSTLASWAADRPWRLCMLRGWTLGEGNINFIKYIWHIYDGHMSDVCVYIYIYLCECVCVWDGGFDLVIYILCGTFWDPHGPHDQRIPLLRWPDTMLAPVFMTISLAINVLVLVQLGRTARRHPCSRTKWIWWFSSVGTILWLWL